MSLKVKGIEVSEVYTIMITDRDTPQPRVQQLANEKTV